MMKNQKLIVFIVALVTNIGFSQQNSIGKYHLELSGGLAKSHQYSPSDVFQDFICFEGCTLEDQKSAWVKNMDVRLYRTLSDRMAVNIGIGYSEVKHRQYWSEYFGSQRSEKIYKAEFFSTSLGLRYFLSPDRSFRLFIENDFIFDFVISEEGTSFQDGGAIRNINLADKLKVGFTYQINKDLSVSANGFFKTALLKYNDRFDFNYLPYSIGFEVGVVFLI